MTGSVNTDSILIHRSWIAKFGVNKASISPRYITERDEKGKPEFYRVSRLDVLRCSFQNGAALADFAETIPVSWLAERYRRFKKEMGEAQVSETEAA